ncbi:hypothetical protein GQ53DRAFT_354255 [Thozetella sp. PMI_491]|nr:hypothetical protein GQ53DRAFT_354255 [Thozetella sp. PMI_491]
MASRSRVEFDERESYYSDRGPRRGREEVEYYERRESHERRAPSRGPPATVIREREREVDRESRVPAFMREDARRPDAGALVLRQREVETIERPRARRSPSPVRVRETRLVERTRSISPAPRRRLEEEDVRVRMVERERVRSPSRGPSVERVRTRVVERERSVSPAPPARINRIQTRYIERGRSPSPVDRERIRIIERERERIPSPSPSPSPPPIIKGPIIEREVITHYRDIDHGMIPARLPSPPPPPRTRAKERDTEIDVYTSRNTTEIDIHKSTHHSRSVSRDRRLPPPRLEHVRGDEIVIASERDRLEVDIQDRHHDRLEVDIHERHRHRRAHSAAPPSTVDYADEAEYITSKIESRGRMGEAYHGATRDWTIVDVPPGTDRVRMDGVGGGGAEVTWQRYNGVRRAKFIPDRESVVSSTTVSDREIAVRDRMASPRESRLSVQVHDKHRDHEIDVDVEKVTDRRISLRPPAPVRKPETWTEITKDLIVREAIEELGYEYEETEFFFYVMQYLRYEDVLELVQLSDQIRRERKERVREIQWEKEWRDEWERDHHNRHRRRHRHRHSHSHDRWEEERMVEREREREVVVDHRGPTRAYIR